MSRGPYLTADQPGTGGVIKREPSDFQVEELPLYQPSGEGEHLYISIEKEGLSTHEVVERVSQIFGVPMARIGYAGLKDKWARTRQVLSVPGVSDIEVLRLNGPHVRVLGAVRHRNKLRVGHLAGNRFHIVLRGVGPEAAARARAILDTLARVGLPNYFGEQRFGRDGRNFERARPWLLHPPRRKLHREQRFQLEAYQSYLFNRYLAARMEKGWFHELLPGDVAMKHASKGMFVVQDVESERGRWASFEISATGPLFGYRMLCPVGAARDLEEAILNSEGLSLRMTEELALKRLRCFGGRRPVRILVRNAQVETIPEGLAMTFELPRGSYATVLLREVMKTDG